MTMDPKQLAKQMVDFNKTAFDNSFNTMSTIQDQTEKNVYFNDGTDGFLSGRRKKTGQ